MSADLLDLDSFYSSPPPSQQPQKPQKLQGAQFGQPLQPLQRPQQVTASSTDLFDFASFTSPSVSSRSAATAAAQPVQQTQTQPWPDFQPPQPSGIGGGGSSNNGGWGDFSAFSSGFDSSTPTQAKPKQQPAKQEAEDDDGWGDFEVAEPTPTQKSFVLPPQTNKARASPPPRTRVARASTFDLMSNNLVDVIDIPYGSGLSPVPSPGFVPGQSQLPDQEFELQGGNDDDDDEFGDFETVQTPFPGANMSPTLDSKPKPKQQAQKSQSSLSMDLLSLDDDPLPIAQPQPQKPQLTSLNLNAPLSPYPQAPKNFVQDEKPKSASPITAWPTFGQTSADMPSAAVKKTSAAPATAKKSQSVDEWGDFDDFDVPSALDSSKPPESWDWDAVDGVQSTTAPAPAAAAAAAAAAPAIESSLIPGMDAEPTIETRDDAPPPINIPPPSVLLSIFPQLLETANTALFKPLNGQMPTVKKKIISDSKTLTFLKGYLALAAVAARVIAGRKQRWHRDKFLAQGMAISAAGAKGMKLAGVDKAQAAREDRETADVIGAWKGNVGKLRSVVVTANSALKKGEQLRVPELSETMPVSTAKVVPTAPKACIICGLKRDERVAKVDVEVEDSFGEWWVEHWGHRACKNFWVEHEKQLRQSQHAYMASSRFFRRKWAAFGHILANPFFI
ncbi:hypothetical protein Cob_v002976 [Colletotrichum orbiculare MAFF 240422]|uniref:Serine threonine-protein kinase ppk6 n=1 Tax=Colletotrichum orbiculare (strain 104-T / ATCC 96160 / CBS 514.97 / LARS 414 / MAFF 240422) TaxID=1213857 RepID=A0A484G3W7_COLOR|nr:hypothetical protein Cob_v002976 [Colletotrichum orbiculare MAFF 240422]